MTRNMNTPMPKLISYPYSLSTLLRPVLAVLLSLGATLPGIALADSEQDQRAVESFPKEHQWRKYFHQAKSAFADHRFSEAKELLLKAGEIKMTPKILGNLAQVELELGEYAAAANHASLALATPNASRGAEEDLAVAAKHVGKLIIHLSVDGAMLHVDGTEIGPPTTITSVYLEPGQHRIVASKAGYTAVERDIVSEQGVEQQLTLTLSAEQETSVQPSVAIPNSVRRASGSRSNAPEPNTPPPEPTRSRSSGPSVALIAVGGAVAIGALVSGLYFDSKARTEYDSVDDLKKKVGPSGCSSGTADAASCIEVAERAEDGDRYRRFANISAIVGATAVLGTGVYWVLSRDASSTEKPAQARVHAVAWPGGALLGYRSSF